MWSTRTLKFDVSTTLLSTFIWLIANIMLKFEMQCTVKSSISQFTVVLASYILSQKIQSHKMPQIVNLIQFSLAQIRLTLSVMLNYLQYILIMFFTLSR
jgi:hypothetical protein